MPHGCAVVCWYVEFSSTSVGTRKLIVPAEKTLMASSSPVDANQLVHEIPGAARGVDGSSRRTREEARSTCVRFSPTGREWAACTTDGLLLYSLDEAAVFDPSNLDENVTPEAVQVRWCFVSVRWYCVLRRSGRKGCRQCLLAARWFFVVRCFF